MSIFCKKSKDKKKVKLKPKKAKTTVRKTEENALYKSNTENVTQSYKDEFWEDENESFDYPDINKEYNYDSLEFDELMDVLDEE